MKFNCLVNLLIHGCYFRKSRAQILPSKEEKEENMYNSPPPTPGRNLPAGSRRRKISN